MNPKPRPNHRKYIQTLRDMSAEDRLLKAFELSDFPKQLFIQGLRKRFPDLSQNEFQKLLLKRPNLFNRFLAALQICIADMARLVQRSHTR